MTASVSDLRWGWRGMSYHVSIGHTHACHQCYMGSNELAGGLNFGSCLINGPSLQDGNDILRFNQDYAMWLQTFGDLV